MSSESDSVLVTIAVCRDFVNDFDLGFELDLGIFFADFNFDVSFFLSSDYDFLAFFKILRVLRLYFELFGLV